MNKFVLKRTIDFKKRVLIPIGLVSLYFFSTYLFKNAFTSGILSIGLLIYIFYSIISDRKYFIEFHRDNIEFYKPSGRLVFSESIKNLNIKKTEIRFKDVLVGLAISFVASDGTEVSIASYGMRKKWHSSVEIIPDAKYSMEPSNWDLFINKLGLGDDLEDLQKEGFEMQQLTKHKNYYQNKIFWWILMGAGIFILFFAALFGWVIYVANL